MEFLRQSFQRGKIIFFEQIDTQKFDNRTSKEDNCDHKQRIRNQYVTVTVGSCMEDFRP